MNNFLFSSNSIVGVFQAEENVVCKTCMEVMGHTGKTKKWEVEQYRNKISHFVLFLTIKSNML